MKGYAILLLIFAAILFGLGAFAYINAGSLPSLISSASAACLISVCALFALRGSFWGLFYGGMCVTALNLFFLARLFMSQKIMPAGVIVLLSSALGIPLLRFLKKQAGQLMN